MNFKNKFNKFKQYSEYFNDLNDNEILDLLDKTGAKLELIDELSKESKDISAEIINAVKQSVKLGLNLKNINVKKLKKAYAELKDLNKSEPSELTDEDKQAIELVVGLTDLFIENNASMRNW